MPTDERTRLRIRQYLIDLMDEEAADAIMDSMPPIPWTQLATKDDIAALAIRIEGVDDRLDTLTLRVDQTSSDLQELTRTVAAQGASLGTRMDGISERMDGISERMDGIGTRMNELGRAVTIGAATVAVTLAVFMTGMIITLIVQSGG